MYDLTPMWRNGDVVRPAAITLAAFVATIVFAALVAASMWGFIPLAAAAASMFADYGAFTWDEIAKHQRWQGRVRATIARRDARLAAEAGA